MKRTVFYILGKSTLHRSKKCCEHNTTYRDLDLRIIDIPENEPDIFPYCKMELDLARPCLKCWNCGEDK